MHTLDAETKQELSDGDEVLNLIASRGWGVIYGKLQEKMLDLQNINNLDDTKPETLSTQLLGRKLAVDAIWAWLKSDVYGYAEQQQQNAKSLVDSDTDSFVDRG